MKTIGMIGGMSWESTLTYYRILNEEVKRRLGGLHSARLVLLSVDFAPVEERMRAGRWDEAGAHLADAAAAVERAGAELLMLCTNTLHKVAPAIERRVAIPFLHIVDATADAVRAQGLRRVALLGTRFTTEEPFYRERLEAAGLEVVIPDASERAEIHRVIFEELVLGVVRAGSRTAFQKVVDRLRGEGAEGAILGCTEIGMLLGASDVAVPLFDTTGIHARAAVDAALQDVRVDASSAAARP